MARGGVGVRAGFEDTMQKIMRKLREVFTVRVAFVFKVLQLRLTVRDLPFYLTKPLKQAPTRTLLVGRGWNISAM